MIAVRIDLASPHHHYFDVTLVIEQPHPNGQVLRLPAWIPGSYMIRDFAKHIVCFEASGPSGALEYIRPDKSSWQIAPSQGPLTVHYRVYAYDASIRAAYFDHHYGFFNGTSLCLEVLEQSHKPHQLTLVASTDPTLEKWQVATGMPAHSVDAQGFGSYLAESYDALIDYPFLLGELTRIPFQASGVPHELVLVGKHYAKQTKLAEDLTKICEAQHQLFGEAPDFDQYLFLTIVTDNGFGGLEHRNSTALMCPRDALEYGTGDTPRDAYAEFLSLCSHEYFHNWNIKRLKPKSFLPYQLDKESYTEQLWFYEGVTSFYDDLMVYRAGCIDIETYLKRLEQSISRGLRGKGPNRQSLVESSLLAWTTFYQQNENAVNAISSYYAKGAVVAACLDLLLRKTSAGEFSLDTVLQTAWTTYGRTGLGTSQEELLAVCNPAQHPDVSAFLQAALYTTETLPWQTLLADIGVQTTMGSFDPISQQMSRSEDIATVELGAALQACPQGLQVLRVVEDSAAALAGLSAGDTLLAIDGLQATEKSLKLVQHRFQAGDQVVVHYFRDARLHHANLIWQPPMREQVHLSIEDTSRLPW